nr:MAG TPA: STRUCTURAL MAINTENANCE OF CHROMOSOMES PROTEIN [Caudoviricetes sp.]
MRITYIRLENYIGIYNGRGDEVLEIDLSQNVNPIVIIRGTNGSGKSTLLKSLTPINDDSNAIVPGVTGRKVIRYLHNGITYEIEYVHPIDKEGKRKQTRGQVYKYGPNGKEELNPTWNVSSAKDIIYSLFNLDSNFLALSQLSSEDRGLADKRPAERKSFVSSIISGIEAYNAMYKIISKKHSMYKSLIQSLTAKINRIGNKEDLDLRYNTITKQVSQAISDRDASIQRIAMLRAKLDENNAEKLLEEYTKIRDKYELNKKERVLLTNSLSKYYKDRTASIYTVEERATFIRDEEMELSENKAKLPQWEESFKTASNEYSSCELKIADINTEINKKKSRLETFIDADFSEEELGRYNEAVDNLKAIENDITKLDYRIDNKSEYDRLKELFDMMNNFSYAIMDRYEFITREDVDTLVSRNSSFYENTLATITKEIEAFTKERISTEADIGFYESLVDKTKNLELKPKDCKFTDCVFIVEAIEAEKKKPKDALVKLSDKLKKLEDELKELNNNLHLTNEAKSFMDKLEALQVVFESNTSYLSKIGADGIWKGFIESITNNTTAKFLEEYIYRAANSYNLLEAKESVSKIVDSLKESAIKYNANKTIIDEINGDIERMEAERKGYEIDLNISYEKMGNYSALRDEYDCLIREAETNLPHLDKIQEIDLEMRELEKKADESKAKRDLIKELNAKILEESAIAERCKDNYNELIAQRDDIAHNKILIDEYHKEMQEYTDNYERIEAIKYYVSPNTGIQTIFIGAYMNDIMVKANELASCIFGGEFVIQPFVINETEFRIPCLGSGLMNDDISSMSTSQICMLSMIISFAILANASTDYNILKLDEIDGGLDTENRIQFITLLGNLISMVGCEQCFLISHNMEYSDRVSVIDMTARPVEVK